MSPAMREALAGIGRDLLVVAIAFGLPLSFARRVDSVGGGWLAVAIVACVGWTIGGRVAHRHVRLLNLGLSPWCRRCSRGPAVSSCGEGWT